MNEKDIATRRTRGGLSSAGDVRHIVGGDCRQRQTSLNDEVELEYELKGTIDTRLLKVDSVALVRPRVRHGQMWILSCRSLSYDEWTLELQVSINDA